MINQSDIKIIVKTAKEAGSEIMKIYNKKFTVLIKDDNTPLTLADKVSNEKIISFLKKKFPDIPYVSEELKNVSYIIRKKWNYFWLIDPLDGTKEFLKKNGEFTVNIALIHKSVPVFGVVHAPAFDKTFWNIPGKGAFSQIGEGSITSISVKEFKLTDENLQIIYSRSHSDTSEEKYFLQFKNPKALSMGSSLKFMLLAEGKAHVYPRFNPTMEWDTAAAHAVLKEAGGKVVTIDTNEELSYNKENLLNPSFIAYGKMKKI